MLISEKTGMFTSKCAMAKLIGELCQPRRERLAAGDALHQGPAKERLLDDALGGGDRGFRAAGQRVSLAGDFFQL